MVLGKEFQLVKFRVLNKFQTKTLFWPVPQLFHLMVNEIFFFLSRVPWPWLLTNLFFCAGQVPTALVGSPPPA